MHPHSNPAVRIQYIHCSRTDVQVGDLVAPWTILGATGGVAPRGTRISGIHLHIQVEEPGNGSERCWQNRNYVDPHTWNIIDTLSGTWMHESVSQAGSIRLTRRIQLSFPASAIGTLGSAANQDLYQSDGCRWDVRREWALMITGYERNCFAVSSTPTASHDGYACDVTLRANPQPDARIIATVLDSSTLRFGDASFQRGHGFQFDQTDMHDVRHSTKPVSERELPYRLSEYPGDIAPLFGLLDDPPLDLFLGVVPDE